MLDKATIDGNMAQVQDMLACEMKFDDIRKMYQLLNEARVLLHSKAKVHVVLVQPPCPEKHYDIEVDHLMGSLLCQGSRILIEGKHRTICRVKLDPSLDIVELEVS